MLQPKTVTFVCNTHGTTQAALNVNLAVPDSDATTSRHFCLLCIQDLLAAKGAELQVVL